MGRSKDTCDHETDLYDSDQYLTGETKLAEESTESTCLSEEDIEDVDKTMVMKTPEILPSTSFQVKVTRPSNTTLRRSKRLVTRKQTPNRDHTPKPEVTDEGAQGDTVTGLYGMLKGAIQDMTMQLVTTIQTAFMKGSRFKDRDLDRKSPQSLPTQAKSITNSSRRSVVTRSRKIRQQIDSGSGSESSDLDDMESDNSSDCHSVDTSRIFRSKTKDNHSIRLPAFTGIEKWEVWYHRFEAVAELKGWDETDKLQELLPRLQGDAGDFAFDELAARTLKNYHKLTKELKSRFGIIEHARTYRLQFNRRKQNSTESPEKYAAELKRLYDKAYRNRDNKTRQEDLIQRFLLGLQDYKARIHIELNKEPRSIDEAVQEAIIYTETMKNPNHQEDNHKRVVRQIRNTNPKDSKVNPDKFQDVQDNEKSDRSELTTLKVESDSEKTGIVTCNKQDLREIFEEMFKVKETGNHLYNAARQNQNRAPASNTNWNPIVSRKPVTCFSCNQPGHIARNCQSTGRTERYSDRGNNRNGQESRTNYLRDSKEIEKTNAGPAYGRPYGGFALN